MWDQTVGEEGGKLKIKIKNKKLRGVGRLKEIRGRQVRRQGQIFIFILFFKFYFYGLLLAMRAVLRLRLSLHCGFLWCCCTMGCGGEPVILPTPSFAFSGAAARQAVVGSPLSSPPLSLLSSADQGCAASSASSQPCWPRLLLVFLLYFASFPSFVVHDLAMVAQLLLDPMMVASIGTCVS